MIELCLASQLEETSSKGSLAPCRVLLCESCPLPIPLGAVLALSPSRRQTCGDLTPSKVLPTQTGTSKPWALTGPGKVAFQSRLYSDTETRRPRILSLSCHRRTKLFLVPNSDAAKAKAGWLSLRHITYVMGPLNLYRKSL